jgi:hypothetical protein
LAEVNTEAPHDVQMEVLCKKSSSLDKGRTFLPSELNFINIFLPRLFYPFVGMLGLAVPT